jgi:diphthine synthase
MGVGWSAVALDGGRHIGWCWRLLHATKTTHAPKKTPDSFYDRIAANRKLGLHTLCLLDIKVKEPNLEALCRGRTVYEPPRYMSVNTAVEQLLEIEAKRGEGAYGPDTLAVGIARLGAPDQQIVAAPLAELAKVDFGAPLHCLVIAGAVHVVEEEMLACYRVNGGGGGGQGEAAATTAAAKQEE